MIEFHTPLPADKAWVDARLAKGNYRGCEYSFTNLFAWAPAYDQQIADVDGFLTARVRGTLGYGYLWPAGSGDLDGVLAQLEGDAQDRGEPFRLVCLTPRQVEELEALRPGQFAVTADRDGFDYLYEIDKLADLGGRKLHSKRNHCKRFQENNPTWTYEDMTPGALAECIEMDAEWDRRSREREGAEEAQDMTNEKKALLLAADHFQELKLEGGVLRVYGEVVAFCMGDVLSSDTFDVHFEKAYGELQGAFAMINQCFARRVREKHPEIKYLNREDDMGIEGLRRAKESYYPDRMVEKHSAARK